MPNLLIGAAALLFAAGTAHAAECCKEGAECCAQHKECCQHERDKPKDAPAHD